MSNVWQPIDLAPKNGRDVDLLVNGVRVPGCRWLGSSELASWGYPNTFGVLGRPITYMLFPPYHRDKITHFCIAEEIPLVIKFELNGLFNQPVNDGNLFVGDYVLVSHFSDINPNDPWGVGFISRFSDNNGAVSITNRDGSPIYGIAVERFWPYAMRINGHDGDILLSVLGPLEGQRCDPEQIIDMLKTGIQQ